MDEAVRLIRIECAEVDGTKIFHNSFESAIEDPIEALRKSGLAMTALAERLETASDEREDAAEGWACEGLGYILRLIADQVSTARQVLKSQDGS